MSGELPVSMTSMATAKKVTAPSAAKKAAAKKPSKRLTAPPKDAVLAAAAPNQFTGKTIDFMGRTILVSMPDENQILVWRKIIRQLQEEQSTKDVERIFVLLERGRRIVDSVIVQEVDREWLDDQLLDRKTTLKDVVEIIILALKVYNPEAKVDDSVAEIE